MHDTWIVAVGLIAAITLGGSAVAYWLVVAAGGYRDKQALTRHDLHELETTVAALIDRLKAASDEAVAAIERRQRELEELLARTDELLAAGGSVPANAPEVYRLASAGVDAAEIARRVGLTQGEVELMLGLRAARG